MENSIKPFDANIDNIVKIKFNNILEGINLYYNYILEPELSLGESNKEEAYINFIRQCFISNKKFNKNNPLIIDCYISTLSTDEYESLLSFLNSKDKKVLKYMYENKSANNYYYIFDEDILDTFVRLCTKELFFITFYFIGLEATIWGNYNFKFPIFYSDENIFSLYKELAYKNRLLLV